MVISDSAGLQEAIPVPVIRICNSLWLLTPGLPVDE